MGVRGEEVRCEGEEVEGCEKQCLFLHLMSLNIKKFLGEKTFLRRMIQSLHFTNASTDQVRQALLIDFNLLTLKQWLRTHFLP